MASWSGGQRTMLSCRFYSNEYPDLNDIVVARPFSISDLCAYVHLLEYDNMEGMLSISELSRRRIRSVNKLLRVGRVEHLQVIRVNKHTKCIDLSKSTVNEDDSKVSRELYARAKTVNSILFRVAEILDYSSKQEFEELYRKTAWYLDEKNGGRKTSSLDVFKAAAKDPSLLHELDIDAATRATLIESVVLKLAKKSAKVGAVIEVTCFEDEGIDAIKRALMAGKSCSTKDVTVKINLIAPPAFNMIVAAPDVEEGTEVMSRALGVIEENILSSKGGFKVASAPKCLTEKDESEMENTLYELAIMNAEVPGDEESGSDADDEI